MREFKGSYTNYFRWALHTLSNRLSTVVCSTNEILLSLKRSLEKGIARFEGYFLGPAPRIGGTSVSGTGAVQLFIETFKDGSEENNITFYGLLDRGLDLPYIAVLTEFQDNIVDENRGGCFILKPACLEDVVPLIEAYLEYDNHRCRLACYQLSRLPCRNDMIAKRLTTGLEKTYHRAFMDMVIGLKKLHVRAQVRLEIYEDESLLGERKSAFLRRLFL